MTKLENDYLSVLIRPQGAELTSLYNKETDVEHLWQADESIWGWHAPNLFPVVGGCIHNQILVDGVEYPMERHGFARHSVFNLIESSETFAKFSLNEDERFIKIYPFKFSFQVLYELIERDLKVTYKVINYDDREIYFAVGGHPAFNVPFKSGENAEDYFLEFEIDEPLRTHNLSAAGFFTGETAEIARVNNCLPLTPGLFAKDALVFKDLVSRKLSLKSKNHPHGVSISYPHFPYLGIWAKNGAPFVCLEPWIGCADREGDAVDLSKKEGVHSLDKGHVFEADYVIGVR
ncbi:aldose 1-epimerase family protein [Flavihumibacter sp. R14]|nr:aldose 1-epimerase family protein [Flavihumibacter soli]